MSDEFIRINIVFMPSANIAEAVAKLSREIGEKEDACFVVDNKNFYPHITIYSPEYPMHNLERVLVDVKKISKELSGVKFRFKKASASQGFIILDFDSTEEIKNIHEAIVENTNDLRAGHINKKYIDSYNMKFSEEKKENIQKYGYPNAMSLYHPHLTITRLKDEKIAEKVAKEIQWPVSEFLIDKIGAYKMGENGTCVELVKEFNLKNIYI